VGVEKAPLAPTAAPTVRPATTLAPPVPRLAQKTCECGAPAKLSGHCEACAQANLRHRAPGAASLGHDLARMRVDAEKRSWA
jgi:hypothetical protein